jgi:AsmA protein
LSKSSPDIGNDLKKLFRWLCISLLALFSLIVIGGGYLSFVLDPNQYKSDVESIAMEAGVELAIEGDLEWQFFPLGIRVNQFNFSLQDKSMAGIVDQLAVGASFSSLLAFANRSYQLPISNVSVVDARILYATPNSLPLQFSNINIQVNNLRFDGREFPVSLNLQAPMGPKLSLKSKLGLTTNQQEIIGFSLSDFQLGFNKVQLTGNLESLNGMNDIQGNIDIQPFNLLDQFRFIKRFVPNLYIPQMADPKALTNMALTGEFNIEANGISEIQTTISVDNQSFDIDVLLDQPQYKLTTLISGNRLDFTKYVPQQSFPINNTALFAPLAIPLAVWHGQSQVELNLNQLKLDNLTIDNIYANLFGNKSIFKLTSFNADAFDGQINATATLNMQGPQANFEVDSSIINLNLEKLIEANNIASGLSGIVNVDATVRGLVNQTTGILRSLTGGGNLSMQSPTYKDINLEKTLCDAASLLSSSAKTNQPWPEDTRLDDLEANFQFSRGKLLVLDYQTGTGNINLSGDATINLLRQSYQFNAVALLNEAKTSSMGCSVSKLLQNREISFGCNGRFDEKARCRPDSDLINSFVKKPAVDSLNRKFEKKLKDKNLPSPVQQLIDKNINIKP